jgi:hypothetical protein
VIKLVSSPLKDIKNVKRSIDGVFPIKEMMVSLRNYSSEEGEGHMNLRRNQSLDRNQDII